MVAASGPGGRTTPSGLADVRAGLLGRLAVANGAAAAAVFVFQAVLAPAELGRSVPGIGGVAVVFAASGSVAAIGGWLITRRRIAVVGGPRSSTGSPWLSDPDALVRAPLQLASIGPPFWAAGAILFASLEAARGHVGVQLARDMAAIAVGAVVGTALTYLLMERRMRPLLAVALQTATLHERSVLGIRTRLAVVWALGSATPLLVIVAGEVSLAPDDPRMSAPAAAFVALGGVALGLVLLTITARSIATPLDLIRARLRGVETGDLSVEIPVDDAGEIGQLEVGFNRMVAGLRERQRLQDLFGRYVSTDVARQALAAGVELGGEQREASVLFVDLANSTGLAQQRSPMAMVALLNAFFSTVVRVVDDQGGWVNKFEGDAALCVFGVPLGLPDHAAAALRAGRHLARALARDGEQWPDLDAAIGISSGIVVAGHVGAEERLEYTVIGDPVNEAARLAELAKTHPSRVLASEAAVNSGGEQPSDWQLAGAVQLRGRSQETVMFEPADR
jgi:adenylate cyclase